MNKLELLNQSVATVKELLLNTTVLSSVDSVLKKTEKNLLGWAPYVFSIGMLILFLLMAVGPDRVKQGARDNFFWVVVAMIGVSAGPGLIQAFLG